MPKFRKGDIEAIKIQIENVQKKYVHYAEGALLYFIKQFMRQGGICVYMKIESL